MRRLLPILILVGLAAVAARPLWSAQFLTSYDGPLHLLRVFALDLTLRQGIVYPRWLFDLAYGYGYPIFNFYPPFAAYTAETLHLLGLGFAEAVKATFIAIIAVALFGAYALGSELFAGEKDHKAIGILTAVAYVFFPYFMVSIYTRGALAEAFAAALLPWLFWSLRRALVRQTSSPALLVALFLAILFVTHSLTTLVVTPLLVAYVALESAHLPAARRIKALTQAAVPAILAIGLSAFYWLPFVVELPLVRMGSGMDILADVFDTNFLRLSSAIQSSWFYDYGGPPVPLGLAATIIGVVALLGAFLAGKRIKERGTVLFFGAVAVIGALAITEPARALWQAVPFSAMIQSVWRVELLINLGLAVVIGSLPLVLAALIPFDRLRRPVADLRSRQALPALTALIALILIWTTVTNLAPAEILLPGNLFDLAHLARFEVSGASPGTTTFGEYLPLTATAPDLVNYRAKGVEKGSAPAPDIGLVRHNGAQWVLTVSASQPVSIPLRAFYFPDWRATVDGSPARAYSSTPMGLLTVDVPSGNHEVQLSVENTPARQIGILVSGETALIVIGWMVSAIGRRESDVWMPLLVSGMLLLVITLPAVVAMTAPSPPFEPKRVSVSSGFDLIGLTVDNARTEKGTWQIRDPLDRLHLRAYWQVKGSGIPDSPIAWRLVDDSGRVWAQRAQFPRYGTALQGTWMPNEIVQDEYDLPFSAAVPPGRYRIQLSPAQQQDFVTGALVQLEAGSRPAADGKPQPAHPIKALLGNRIRLLGYDGPETARSGERYALMLYWQAEQDVFEDYTVSAQLLDPAGKLVAQHDSITGEGLNPTSLWVPGEPVVERRHIELPRGLKPGEYTLIVLMYNLRDLKRLPVVTDAGPAPDDAILLRQIQVSNNSQVDLLNVNTLFAARR